MLQRTQHHLEERALPRSLEGWAGKKSRKMYLLFLSFFFALFCFIYRQQVRDLLNRHVVQ